MRRVNESNHECNCRNVKTNLIGEISGRNSEEGRNWSVGVKETMTWLWGNVVSEK